LNDSNLRRNIIRREPPRRRRSALEAVVTGHLAAGRQGAALGGDALDVASQFDLLAKRAVRATRYSALSWGIRTGLSRQFGGRGQGFGLSVHRTVLRFRKIAGEKRDGFQRGLASRYGEGAAAPKQEKSRLDRRAEGALSG
jgi:hypothetical protein